MLLLGGLHIALAATLTVFLLLPANLPSLLPGNYVYNTVVIIGLGAMLLLQGIAVLRTGNLIWFGMHMLDPIPMQPQSGLRVAVLTTIVPGKEPIEMVMKTLRAMKRIRHDGPIDVWLLDEGNDPEVQHRCAEIGVRHFSRKGIERFNQPSGEFRAKSKAGNHNAWRAAHESDYDIIAQMDPDHIPHPCFLERGWILR
jgi:cellulose synthase/poly-beta-1,6-N-acetylglucosamine synthase-like glycosyltransferase